ncbi:MAG: histidine kinase [Bacteroidetes bacterium HGW-Bacteroidetes-14]|jgi:nitrogen fixation/metabolism regulation signal transduction histidine kinase|nr:MAG: histidine kinase [Bacteroidetes bacterium HGW-Bacteroidetes-14]
MTIKEITHYAPALRSSTNQIKRENEILESNQLFRELFSAIGGIVAVIDSNRQLVYANEGLLSLLGEKSMEAILGNRLGEAISCVHSKEEPYGCGTSKACAYCGLVNAVLESQNTGSKSTKECRISSNIEGKIQSWDLNVTVFPIVLSDITYHVITILDISDEKRRLALEKIFFHDILNSAGGLNGLLTILKEASDPEESRELIDLSEEVSRDILEEIILHKQIKAAETGDLKVKIELINSMEILESSIIKIKSHESVKNKAIVVSEDSSEVDFETDRILLQRILINLIKNALESTKPNGSVIAGIKETGDKIRFWIRNEEVMPAEIQMQIFQRSFSTKGSDRGIGTYSIKLLAENYLKGKVDFSSNESEGTIFWVDFNKKY